MAIHSSFGVLGRAVTVAAIIVITTASSWAQQPAFQSPETGSGGLAYLEATIAQPHLSVGRWQTLSYERLPSVNQEPWTNSSVVSGGQFVTTANPYLGQTVVPIDSQISRAQGDAGCKGGCGKSDCDDCLYDKVKSMSRMDSFFEKVDITGDIRIRQEVDFERNGAPTRNRTRIRVRPGFIYHASDEWEAELRMHTGAIAPGAVTNPHGDLGQGVNAGFNRHQFNLDRMAIKYTPHYLNGAYIKGGKFGYPMVVNPITKGPMNSQIWDTNVQMEGIVVGQTFKDRLGLDSMKVTAGVAPVLTQSGADEASLIYGQIWTEKELNSDWTAGAGVTYWNWQNLNADGSTVLSTPVSAGGFNRGNATTGGFFDSHFHIVHPLVTLTYDDHDVCSGLDPIVLSYEAYQNTGAFDPNRDFGFLVGAAYGRAMKTKHQWDWAIWYLWVDIQQDAVMSIVSDGDFLSGTNFRGHTFGLIFFPIEGNARINAGFYSDEPVDPMGGTQKMQWRFRTDVVISF